MTNACTTIGLPLPPINLSEELSLNPELLNITFTWQPPLGLVINDDLMYVISVNVSIQNLTNQYYEVITSNLSHSTEQENYLKFCMHGHLTYDNVTVVIRVSVSSKNKVGTGMEVHSEILLDSLCANANAEYTRTSESGKKKHDSSSLRPYPFNFLFVGQMKARNRPGWST